MAYNNQKKPVAEHVYADTQVWQCPECNIWSRTEFVSEEKPECPMCKTQMELVEKNIRIE